MFEAADRVGGRVESFEWHGEVFEAGAAVFTTFNYLLHELVRSELNLTMRGDWDAPVEGASADLPNGTAAADDADDDDAAAAAPTPSSSRAVFLYEGDVDSLRAWPLPEASLYTMRVFSLAQRFKRDLLRSYLNRVDTPTATFRTVREFATGGDVEEAAGLTPYLTQSIDEMLRARGISAQWIHDAITPVR